MIIKLCSFFVLGLLSFVAYIRIMCFIRFEFMKKKHTAFAVKVSTTPKRIVEAIHTKITEETVNEALQLPACYYRALEKHMPGH